MYLYKVRVASNKCINNKKYYSVRQMTWAGREDVCVALFLWTQHASFTDIKINIFFLSGSGVISCEWRIASIGFLFTEQSQWYSRLSEGYIQIQEGQNGSFSMVIVDLAV